MTYLFPEGFQIADCRLKIADFEIMRNYLRPLSSNLRLAVSPGPLSSLCAWCLVPVETATRCLLPAVVCPLFSLLNSAYWLLSTSPNTISWTELSESITEAQTQRIQTLVRIGQISVRDMVEQNGEPMVLSY